MVGRPTHAIPLRLSQTLLTSDPSTIEASNFQTDRKTRFIIHGFIDKGDESWVLKMCKVGPAPGPVARSASHHHPCIPLSSHSK